MEKFDEIFTLLFKYIPGSLFGLLSVIVGVLGDLIAFLHYPGYNIIDNMVSDLGNGPGGVFFNVSMIFSGIFAFIYFVYISKILKYDNNANSNNYDTVRKAGLVCAYTSSIFFSLIGVFPSYENYIIIFTIHGICAFTSWISAVGYLSFFCYLFSKDIRFSKFESYSGLVLVAFFIFFFFTFSPLTEWILNFVIIVWWFYFPSVLYFNRIN